MLYSVKDIEGFKLNARDGEIGSVDGVYLDDDRWVIRHLVVATGGWLSGRKVLISPHSVTGIDRAAERFDVALTREEIRHAPDIDTDQPVSRHHEIAYYDYYRYPYYWSGPALWGGSAYPTAYPMTGGAGLAVPPPDAVDDQVAERARAERQPVDMRLRSSDELIGYAVDAADGRLGSVEDLLFDTDAWAVRDVVVDTGDWLPGPSLLVPARAIEPIDADDRVARVKLTRARVTTSPLLEPDGNTVEVEYAKRRQRAYRCAPQPR